MRKIFIALMILLLGTSVAFAQSKVSGKVINKSKVDKSANVAIGKGATANMGSVTMKNSQVSGKVINDSKVDKSANVAIGKGSEANMGSVTME